MTSLPRDDTGGPSSVPQGLETTRALLERIRTGDEAAQNHLIARFLPGLTRWAHGRLPSRARGLIETNDLVQLAFLRALERVHEFQPGREGSFLSYLHRILINLVRDEARRVRRQPERETIVDDLIPDRETLLTQTLGPDVFQAYERALQTLPEEHREAVVLRIEFGFTHQEIADALGRPSANAVRMQIARAMVRMSEEMDVDPPARR